MSNQFTLTVARTVLGWGESAEDKRTLPLVDVADCLPMRADLSRELLLLLEVSVLETRLLEEITTVPGPDLSLAGTGRGN